MPKHVDKDRERRIREQQKLRIEAQKKELRKTFLRAAAAPGEQIAMLESVGVALDPVAETEPTAEADPQQKATVSVELAADGQTASIRLYGAIGGYFGVSAREFAETLDATGSAKTIELHINSGGGSVFDAVAIYNLLASSGKRVVVIVEGVAASAATLVTMAGDERRIAENAFWMIHKARGGVYGTSEEIRNYIELLEKANNSLLLTYQARTGIDRATLEQLTSKDTWMSAAEAQAGGWVDTVIEAKKVKPHVAPKSEAVTTADYDRENWQRFVDDVHSIVAAATLAVEVPKESPVEPSSKTESQPEKEASNMPNENAVVPTAATEIVEPDNTAITDRIAQYQRIAAVDEHLAKYPALAAQALSENWDAGRMQAERKLADLRDRPTGPAIHGGDGAALTQEVYECALAQSYGAPVATRYSEQVQDQANKKFRNRLGIKRLLLEQAWANNYDRNEMDIHPGNIRSVLRHCQEPTAGGFSTLGTTGILGNTANKAIKDMFMNLDSTWREIASVGSVMDFKLVTRYRLLGHMEFEEVSKDGELKHGALTEESHTEKIKTYGKMFALTREDIINDDLGAFDDLTRAIANGGGFALNTVFWTKFLDNSTFFTTARGNLVEGAAYALSSAGLTKAVQTFREMKITGHGKDSGSHPLGIAPKLLLVPPALEVTANELFVSTNLNTGGSSTTAKVPNRNVFAGMYRPVVCSYLSAAFAISGYSDTAYYLLADPAQLATIKVLFLNGQQTPVVESADADFNVLGIQIRSYLDFGVAQTEYRAGVKATGTT